MIFNKTFNWGPLPAIHFVRKIKFFLLTFIFSQMIHNVFAQLSITNTEMRMVDIGNNQVNGICNISISDTSDCNIVAIELNDALNENQIFSREFAFDQLTGLPMGISWIRNGNEIEIGMGNLPICSVWKGKIRLKDNTGAWTQWQEFIFN